MTNRSDLGGAFTLPSTSITVNRMGYGAMQLAGRDGDIEGGTELLGDANGGKSAKRAYARRVPRQT